MATFRPKAVFEQAQSEEARGNLRVAASHYATVGLYLRRKSKFREARRLLLKAVSLHPSSARLYLHLAGVEAALKNFAPAATAMRAFCTTASVRGKLREYEAQVRELVGSHPGLALIYYQKWLEIDRTEPRLLLQAATLLEKIDDVAGALNLLKEAFELAAQDRQVREELQAFLNRQKDTVRLHAWEGYEAGRLTKDQMLSVLAGDLVLAVGSDKKHDAVRPATITLEKSLSSMIASLEDQLGGITDSAPLGESEEIQISDLKPLVQEFRRHADEVIKEDDATRWDMAHAFSEMGLNDEAVDELKKIPPESEWYLRGLLKQAEIFMDQQSYLSALDCLQRVIRTDAGATSSFAEALYQAAHVYYHLSDLEQSLKTLEILNRKYPDYRESRSLKMRVEGALKKSRTGT